MPVDLRDLFRGRGPLPTVAEVANQTGPGDDVGRTRSVALSDGSQLVAEITDVTLPTAFRENDESQIPCRASRSQDICDKMCLDHFSKRFNEQKARFGYVVRGYSGLIGRFTRLPSGPVARLPLSIIAPMFWAGYMREALKLTKEMKESLA